jgi:hypothetical protein
MKLYDFAMYAKRRDERLAQATVTELVDNINRPGAILVLKQQIASWFKLHQEVITHIDKAA